MNIPNNSNSDIIDLVDYANRLISPSTLRYYYDEIWIDKSLVANNINLNNAKIFISGIIVGAICKNK